MLERLLIKPMPADLTVLAKFALRAASISTFEGLEACSSIPYIFIQSVEFWILGSHHLASFASRYDQQNESTLRPIGLPQRFGPCPKSSSVTPGTLSLSTVVFSAVGCPLAFNKPWSEYPSLQGTHCRLRWRALPSHQVEVGSHGWDLHWEGSMLWCAHND